MEPFTTIRALLLAALLMRLACGQATKTCGQAVAGYRFYGGGFNTGGADRLGEGQDYGATRDSADACRAWCQSDSRCSKWVYHTGSKACWRMTSGYTGTASDALFVSGSCSDTAGPCAGYSDSSTLISPDCIYKLWADAGCSPNNAASMPHAYWRDPWWAAATKAVIAQDMRVIAADPSDLKRGWCYRGTQGLRTGGIVARPAEYRPYLTSCSWLNRPYNADTISTVSPVKCRDPANPADQEWYLFQYNSGQANWASVGLTWEVYTTAKVDPTCTGADCYVEGCARESCCVALCADTVAKGGNCTWQSFDIGGGVMKRWYDIRPVNQPSTACDPRGGGGKGSGSGRGGGRGRHLLGQHPPLATTSNSVGPLEPAQRAHRRSLKQDVVAVPDRYLCDSRSDPSCYNFSYEYSIEADGVLRIVNIDCPSCPQDNALAVQLVAQML